MGSGTGKRHFDQRACRSTDNGQEKRCYLTALPDYSCDAFRFNKVINYMSYVNSFRAASLPRAQRGKLVACRVEHLKSGVRCDGRLLGQFGDPPVDRP